MLNFITTWSAARISEFCLLINSFFLCGGSIALIKIAHRFWLHLAWRACHIISYIRVSSFWAKRLGSFMHFTIRIELMAFLMVSPIFAAYWKITIGMSNSHFFQLFHSWFMVWKPIRMRFDLIARRFGTMICLKRTQRTRSSEFIAEFSCKF